MALIAGKIEASAQAEMNKIYLRQLRIISLIVAAYYAFISLAHTQFLDEEVLAPVLATSILASVGTFTVFLLVRARKIAPHMSHMAFIPVGLLGLFTIFTHIFVSQDELQLTNAVLGIYVFGYLTLSPLIFTGMLLVAVIGFLLAVNIIPMQHEAHYCFMLLAAVLLSTMGFILRYKTLLNSVKLTDSSRRKTQKLVEASREIEKRVAEAEKANAAKDDFLANITHELRTPLTGTMGMLELLHESRLSADQQFMVETAQKSSDYLLGIINDILDLSMLDASKLQLSEEAVDLVHITRQAMDSFREEASAKGISLSIGRVPNGQAVVYGDEARLLKLLSKLIGNAVKFTEKGGIIISCDWAPPAKDDEPKAVVTWRVADTGPGIPEENIARMFDRFAQLDTRITRTRAGTGLGLSIVHELVSLMGGKIDVKSDVDKGAIFTVTLELPTETEAEQEEELEPASTEQVETLHLKALVAEDNHINQMVIRSMLQKLGMSVTIVGNGELAVEACDQAGAGFDIVFMDIQMPVMDGISASKIIKLRSATPPPIIAVTANTSDSDVQTYLDAGVDAVIGKPIDFDRFRAVILSVLDKSKQDAVL